MTLVHLTENDYDPFWAVLSDWITRRDRHLGQGSGGPKMVEARNQAAHAGRLSIIEEMVAAEVNRRRINFLSTWKSVPILFGSEAHRLVNQICQAYDTSKHLADENKANGPLKVDWNEWQGKVEALLDDAAITNELRDGELQRHRDAVIGGFEQPTEDDIAWLTEEQGKAADEARRLAKLGTLAERAKSTGV